MAQYQTEYLDVTEFLCKSTNPEDHIRIRLGTMFATAVICSIVYEKEEEETVLFARVYEATLKALNCYDDVTTRDDLEKIRASFVERLPMIYSAKKASLPESTCVCVWLRLRPAAVGTTNASVEKDGDDIEVGDQTLQFQCPLSLRRMVHPSKGILCDHIQCFDLQVS